MISVSHCLAKRKRLPFMVSELSQRVGLYLLYDQYGMEVAAKHFGAQHLFLPWDPTVKVSVPKMLQSKIDSRCVNLNPLHPKKVEDYLRLIAYDWPDKAGKIVWKRSQMRCVIWCFTWLLGGTFPKQYFPKLCTGNVMWLKKRLAPWLPLQKPWRILQ